MTRTWNITTSTLAVIGLLGASLAVAQQTDKDKSKTNDRQQTTAGDQQTIEIPQALKDLNLTSEQQDGIKKAMRTENEQLQQAWQKFNDAHMKAIELEASWVAAVRDTLSEEDQQKFDQERMQQREMAKNADHSAKGNHADKGQQDRQQKQADDQATQKDATRQGKDRAEKQGDQDRKEKTSTDRQQSQAKSDKNAARSDQSAQDEEEEEEFVLITVYSPEQYVEGTDQSSDQKQQCSQVCQDYKQQLQTAWGTMHRLHAELVQLEADRFQAIEKQLTKEQLTQLRENRQKPSAKTAAATSQKR